METSKVMNPLGSRVKNLGVPPRTPLHQSRPDPGWQSSPSTAPAHQDRADNVGNDRQFTSLPTRRNFLGTSALAAGGALALAACGSNTARSAAKSSSSPITLKYSNGQTLDNPITIEAMDCAKRIHEMTNGEVTMDVYANYTLAPSDTVALQQLASGSLDMANVSSWSSLITPGNVMYLPYVFTSLDLYRKAFAGKPGDILKGVAPAHGVQIMGWYVISFRELYGNRVIDNFDDLKGAKIRTEGDAPTNAFYTAAGADPVTISSTEVYLALETKEVDLVESSFDFCYEEKQYEVSKYGSSDNHGVSANVQMMSSRTYERLSSKNRDIIFQVFNESVPKYTALDTVFLTKIDSSLEAYGMKLNNIPDLTPFYQTAKRLYPQFITTATDKKLFKAIQAMGGGGAGV